MPYLSGFVPTGQAVDPACRSAAVTGPPARKRPRSAGQGLAGFALLLLGFCLLILGQTIPAP